MRRSYPSKKDVWLVGVAAAAVLLPFVQAVYICSRSDAREAWIPLLVGVSIGAATLLLAYPVCHDLTLLVLEVRSGALYRKQIPLSAIQTVRPTRNPLSAPAWSLDRLRVSYEMDGGEGFVLISPKDKIGFVRELAARDAGLGSVGRAGRSRQVDALLKA